MFPFRCEPVTPSFRHGKPIVAIVKETDDFLLGKALEYAHAGVHRALIALFAPSDPDESDAGQSEVSGLGEMM